MRTRTSIHLDKRKIQIFLLEKGLRSADLARMWGVSGAAVSRAISGKRPYSILVGKLAQFMGISREELLFKGDESKRRRAA